MTEIRRCFDKGGAQRFRSIDFTEGRFAIKVDPTGALLNTFIELNNLALSRFSAEERAHRSAHLVPGWRPRRAPLTAPTWIMPSSLPSLFKPWQVGSFYVALAGEKDRTRVHKIIRNHLRPHQAGLRRRHRHDRSPHRDRRGSSGSDLEAARPFPSSTIGHDGRLRGSRHSATTHRRAATRPSQRSARASSGPRWQREPRRRAMTGESDDEEEKLLRSVALQNANSTILAPTRGAGAGTPASEGSARKEDAGACPFSVDDPRRARVDDVDAILVTDEAEQSDRAQREVRAHVATAARGARPRKKGTTIFFYPSSPPSSEIPRNSW